MERTAQSATVTIQGAAVGTASYMSPNKRAESGWTKPRICRHSAVFCTSYLRVAELSPERASLKLSPASWEREPDWQALRALTPAKIQDVVRRALQKNRIRHAQDLGDARIQIEQALNGLVTSRTRRAPRQMRSVDPAGNASSRSQYCPWQTSSAIANMSILPMA